MGDFWRQQNNAVFQVGNLSEEVVEKAVLNICGVAKDASDASFIMETLGIKEIS